MKRLFLEGLPGAGKSTLIHDLEARQEPVVHELGLVLGVDAFPGNGNTVGEVLAIDDWFIDKEEARLRNAHGIYDRSYLTHLTYAYGYGKYAGLGSFGPTVHKYAEALETGVLATPDAILYLDVEPELAIERQKKRISQGIPALDSFWMDKFFLSDLQEAYDQLFAACNDIPIYHFDGRNQKEQIIDEMAHSVDTVMKEKDRANRSIDLGRYVLSMEAKR